MSYHNLFEGGGKKRVHQIPVTRRVFVSVWRGGEGQGKNTQLDIRLHVPWFVTGSPCSCL